jgi:hypothetical protein
MVMRTQLARDLKLVKSEEHEKLAIQTNEVQRMLTGLLSRLKAAEAKS